MCCPPALVGSQAPPLSVAAFIFVVVHTGLLLTFLFHLRKGAGVSLFLVYNSDLQKGRCPQERRLWKLRHHGRGRSLVPSCGPEDVPGPVLRSSHSLLCGPCAWTCPVASQSLGCSVDGQQTARRGAGWAAAPWGRAQGLSSGRLPLHGQCYTTSFSHPDALRLFLLLVIV